MDIERFKRIQTPKELRKLSPELLKYFSDELRKEIIKTLSTGEGHLGSSLGAVELSVALHYCFDTPFDILIWDVGHQAYVHKMLTGRRSSFKSIRKKNGISGFPKREESEYDTFGTGHAGTAISAALGMAISAKLQNKKRHHIAIVGDASIVNGMAFEALNHLGTTKANVLIILNDNSFNSSILLTILELLVKVLSAPLVVKLPSDDDPNVSAPPSPRYVVDFVVPLISSSWSGSKIVVPIPARPTTSRTLRSSVLSGTPIFCCCCLPERTRIGATILLNYYRFEVSMTLAIKSRSDALLPLIANLSPLSTTNLPLIRLAVSPAGIERFLIISVSDPDDLR